ncbi:MAG: glycine cleavage system protein H [Acidobacteriia bacterium]|nr:glycine cleavage system protein H [Terriglobia bacterium]
MPDYLETTIDKFTFRVATDRVYSPEGIWLLLDATPGPPRVRVGVTDFVQQHNGDMAFANVKPQRTSLAAGDPFAELETMKVTFELASPIAGTVAEINQSLEFTPELINQDPYDRGWLALIETTDWDVARTKLLDPAGYLKLMQSQAEEELKS